MNESKSSGPQAKPHSNSNVTEQDVKSHDHKKEDKSSKDAKSNVKAGSDAGAGGGSKQKQNH
ncbi:MAG: hypothetical protein V4857_02180 [Pseudomonadota bacterium]